MDPLKQREKLTRARLEYRAKHVTKLKRIAETIADETWEEQFKLAASMMAQMIADPRTSFAQHQFVMDLFETAERRAGKEDWGAFTSMTEAELLDKFKCNLDQEDTDVGIDIDVN